MSGITPIVDTLLATTLTQRLDLVPLKSALQLSEPTAVTNAGVVNNDLRLPSRAATDAQLGRGLQPMAGAADMSLYSTEAPLTLSATARAISTILGSRQNGTGSAVFIKGETPLLPTMPFGGRPALPVQLLTSVLARVVSHSGLFYESHLVQYSSGLRSLAQMAQEPQARLGALAQNRPALFGANGTRADLLLWAEQASEPLSALANKTSNRLFGFSMPSGSQGLGATMAAEHGFVAARPAASVQPESQPAPEPAPQPAPQQSTSPLAFNPLVTDMLTAYSEQSAREDIAHSTGDSGHGDGLQDVVLSEKSSSPPASQNDKTSVLNSISINAEMHPDAAELVRQQLNFLSLPVFRWRGEAWPGGSMEWELSQQNAQSKDQRNSQNDQMDATAVSWNTCIKLNLPSLGAVELRLDLVGQSIQANILVSDDVNANHMRDQSADLRCRFMAGGLNVTLLQISTLESTSESTGTDVGDNNVVKKS